MPNIVLCRIDERLIHGQVGVQWVGFAGANTYWSRMTRWQRIGSTEPDGNGARGGDRRAFLVIAKVIDNIHRAADRQKILLVCKSPADFLKLVEGRAHHPYQRRKHALRQWQTTNCQNGICRRGRYRRLQRPESGRGGMLRSGRSNRDCFGSL